MISRDICYIIITIIIDNFSQFCCIPGSDLVYEITKSR